MIVDVEKPIPINDLETIIIEGSNLSFPLIKRADLYNEMVNKWNDFLVEMAGRMKEKIRGAINDGSDDDYNRYILRIASNGSRYRLDSVTLKSKYSDGMNVKGAILEMSIGLTSFMEYMSTGVAADHHPEYRRKLINAGIEDAGNPYHYFANPLATCAAIITKEGYSMVGQRSKYVSTHPGWYNVVGGFVRPNEFNDPNFSLEKIDFYENMKQELNEEVGVDDEDIQHSFFSGIVRHGTSLHPELMYIVNLNLDKNELLDKWKVAKDNFEHKNLLFVPVEKLYEFVRDSEESFSPSGEAVLLKVYDFYSKSILK